MPEKNNPCGLDGFAFVEFADLDSAFLSQHFEQMGFQRVAKHKTQEISLYQQGSIQFLLNATKGSQAEEHAKMHGPGASAMGFRVKNAKQAYEHVLKQGAVPFEDCPHAEHGLLGIHAIGGSVIYFVDETLSAFEKDWLPHTFPSTEDCGLSAIDHLTHNVYRGNMDKWAHFYESLFNFREIRFFNIVGQMTGLVSRALASPCNKIKIPLNESKDDLSQIEEFLHEYHGEGIQHIALNSNNIYHSVNKLRAQGVRFLDVPDTYYEMIHTRIPWHKESLENLKNQRILIDGEREEAGGLLLQIFTTNVFGPVFFEIIQRHGNEGFGEGNFQALFEAIERDQIKRGTLHKSL